MFASVCLHVCFCVSVTVLYRSVCEERFINRYSSAVEFVFTSATFI